MHRTILILLAVAAFVAVPAVASADAPLDGDCPKLVGYERCPWPGGAGEFCVGGSEYKVCFGPI